MDLRTMQWPFVQTEVLKRLHVNGRVHVSRAQGGWIITIYGGDESVQLSDLNDLNDFFKPGTLLVSDNANSSGIVIEMLFS